MMPELVNEYTGLIDSMINTELENMRLLVGTSKKKKKGKKKGKKKKKKKKKSLNLPGYKYIKDLDREELLTKLIQVNLAKKVPSCRLREFIGEFNYIHSMLDDIKDTPYDPSMALIRQLVTEYIIFPLGSELVRNRVLENIRSFMFYGPSGSGKTMIMRACLTETNSLLIDMSPNNIDGKYSAKKEEDIMIATVMIAAKEF
jgi:SpoVK/Ycf46/Vps4 family AAA+-type ATPase